MATSHSFGEGRMPAPLFSGFYQLFRDLLIIAFTQTGHTSDSQLVSSTFHKTIDNLLTSK